MAQSFYLIRPFLLSRIGNWLYVLLLCLQLLFNIFTFKVGPVIQNTMKENTSQYSKQSFIFSDYFS